MLSSLRVCPTCDKGVWSEELTHCVDCGTELEYRFDQGYICSDCGNEIEEDWQYCGYCGGELVMEDEGE